MPNSLRRANGTPTFDHLEGRALLAVGATGQLNALATTRSTSTSTNSAFVDQVFQVVLGRSPGAVELTDITHRLASGKITRNELSLGVLNSKEDLTHLVNQTYMAVNGAPPTTAQLNAGVSFLAGKHGSLNALSAHIYGTTEYRTVSSITNNTTFVNNVASDSGVTLTSAQTTAFVKQLDSGQENSAEVAKTIITSHDSLVNQIDTLYTDYLSTTATRAQQTSAFATIARGHRWGLRLALIDSTGFAAV